MSIEGVYEPSTQAWVRDQIEVIERSGGREGTTLRGMPVVVVTMRGAKSGLVRKAAVMRVEHDGAYAVVASKGGAPEHPGWYHNMVADPHVVVQDGPETHAMVAHLAQGQERAEWWERSVAAFPDYATYQTKTDREIPVFVVRAEDTTTS